ncbi:hypothetical protein QJS66_09805 [Kocuria rhizophila]|nr:hypothetical protein QJS66_09805 [Kocuria rhizophila]
MDARWSRRSGSTTRGSGRAAASAHGNGWAACCGPAHGSDRGHDFRRTTGGSRRSAVQPPDSAAVLATTATANERVIEDVREQLGRSRVRARCSPCRCRPARRCGWGAAPSTSARLAWLLAHLDELPGSGIMTP